MSRIKKYGQDFVNIPEKCEFGDIKHFKRRGNEMNIPFYTRVNFS